MQQKGQVSTRLAEQKSLNSCGLLGREPLLNCCFQRGSKSQAQKCKHQSRKQCLGQWWRQMFLLGREWH